MIALGQQQKTQKEGERKRERGREGEILTVLAVRQTLFNGLRDEIKNYGNVSQNTNVHIGLCIFLPTIYRKIALFMSLVWKVLKILTSINLN